MSNTPANSPTPPLFTAKISEALSGQISRLVFGVFPAVALGLITAPVLAADLPTPPTQDDFLKVSEGEAALGQLLFYDPILSGNDNISCSTCHHPKLGTADGLSLGLGEGGIGLGSARFTGAVNIPEGRIPRNAPALYNLGALEYRTMFHDGRVERVDGKLRVPIEDDFLDRVSGILATQAAFPVLSPDEMAGQVNENDIAKAVRMGRFSGVDGAWDLIAKKVAALPAYREMFAAVYPETAQSRPIHFADIANAIAAFITYEFTAIDSPFDKHLRGEAPLTGLAAQGMELFYGEAGCAGCHAGAFQTDHRFHAMGQPQFGPGKTLPFEKGARDQGRFRVTGKAEDLYAFRTPSLRNVTLTAPYGHTGAFADLWEFISAHGAPHASFAAWSPAQVVLPALPVEDFAALEDEEDRAGIVAAVAVEDRLLRADELDALVAFLAALEDNPSRLGIPSVVPSGLPFEQ